MAILVPVKISVRLLVALNIGWATSTEGWRYLLDRFTMTLHGWVVSLLLCLGSQRRVV